ncbi:MAG: efflux RND transporter periplasmic adaptor subunit [Candidatus Aminicenantes bacterium]|nr:efflux RND transporter periplasmic adaptor subunit [Candidatus Aminicenantes bacterium]
MKYLRLVAAFVLIVLAASTLPACKPSAKEAANPSAAAGAAATVVSVVPAARQTVSEKLTYTGTLEAWRKINITPETGGKVARILVEEGQRVAAGQLLAELDAESIGLQLRQAEAGLAVAQASYDNAVRTRDRMDRLQAQKAVSEQQSEQARLGFDAAKAQLEQARAGVALARHARASAVMTAPWAGIISSKNAQVGDVINPMMGGYGVVTLVDDSRIKVIVEVTPGDVGRLQKGHPALLRVSNGESSDHSGLISVINQTGDPLSKKFRVEVDVPNPGWKLRPGVYGTIVFEVQSHPNALAVPQKAILENKYVFLAENGKAVKHPVTLGLKNTTTIEVLDGLKEGDLVIIEGNFGLIEGSPVEIKK